MLEAPDDNDQFGKKQPSWVIILNDGETWTSLEGCQLALVHGTRLNGIDADHWEGVEEDDREQHVFGFWDLFRLLEDKLEHCETAADELPPKTFDDEEGE